MSTDKVVCMYVCMCCSFCIFNFIHLLMYVSLILGLCINIYLLIIMYNYLLAQFLLQRTPHSGNTAPVNSTCKVYTATDVGHWDSKIQRENS